MDYSAKKTITMPKLSDTKLCGHQKDITEKFFHERLFSERARETIWKECCDAFVLREDDRKPAGLWQGEFWGKQMLSACDAYLYANKKEYLDCIKEEAYKLIATADDNGYIGTYKNSLNLFLPTDENCIKWNWNIWGRKYTLWGLVSAYEVTGDKKILEAAYKMALHLINELYDNGIAIVDTGTFSGMPSCSILKPMLLLYKHTEDKKLFDFCKNEILDKWEREDGACPNIIANSLAKKPVAHWYPEPSVWAKAYEMMSCVEGIIEYYKLTGEKKYFDAVKNFVDLIIEHEENLLGSVAYIDMFHDAKYSVNAVSEPCDSIHYMRLCHELYVITGDSLYMDKYEKCFFNAFFAGMFKDGKWAARAVRGAGRHMWTKQARTLYQNCCVNNMARTLATYGENAVVTSEKGIIINLFAPFEVDTDAYAVKINEGYFIGKPVEIKVSFKAEAKNILLRMPEWCEKLCVSGKEYFAENGYVTVTPEGRDITLSLDFNMKLIVHPFEYEANDLCKNDWHFFRWMTSYAPACCTCSKYFFVKDLKCVITYGPLVLAKSKNSGLSEAEIFDGSSISKDTEISVSPIDCDGMFAAFEAEYTVDGKTVKTKLCDYASAANEMPADENFFSMYF